MEIAGAAHEARIVVRSVGHAATEIAAVQVPIRVVPEGDLRGLGYGVCALLEGNNLRELQSACDRATRYVEAGPTFERDPPIEGPCAPSPRPQILIN